MRKLVLTTMVVLLAMTTAISQNYDFSAVAPSGQTLYYTISNGVAMVTYENTTIPRYTSLSGALIIPDSVSYNGTTYAVGRINTNAFFGCSNLTAVTIPTTITYIGNAAFRDCAGLTTVNYNADSCYQMGTGSSPAFYRDSAFTTLNIGNTVRHIPNHAFRNCVGLTSLTIPNSVTSIGMYSFAYCTGLQLVTIPNSVTSIGSQAFNGVRYLIYSGTATGAPWSAFGLIDGDFVYNDVAKTNLKKYVGNDSYVTIPGTVTSINANAFDSCTFLTSVSIPTSVTSIGTKAFRNCTGLTSITIPHAVTSIGDRAFYNCTGLTTVNFNADSCLSMGTSVQNIVFLGCTSLTTLNIGANVKRIPNYAFAYCTELTSLVIPDSVTYLGNNAFNGCTGLTSITIGNSVTSIGNYYFSGCTALTSLTIGNSVTSIGTQAFSSCSNLTSVIIPNSVTSIGSHAFRDCTSLTTVTIPPAVTAIASGAFGHCSGLTTVNFNADSCVTMGGSLSYLSVFDSCTALTTVNIGPNVTRIPNGAFRNCTGLISITIPDAVMYIGLSAFANCTSLTSANIGSSAASISNDAFSGCTELASLVISSGNTVYDSRDNCNAIIETATNTLLFGCKNTIIPTTVTIIGTNAFKGCISLTTITIPQSITNIRNNAFLDCTGLTTVNFNADSCQTGNNAASTSPVFSSCTALSTVNIGSNVKMIPNNVFSICTGLSSITIPPLMTYIGTNAFSYCTGLTTVNFNADSCWQMGGANTATVFRGCTSLTTLNIGSNVRHIPDNAFYNCSGITSLSIPSSVTSIGSNAFYNCSGFTSVTIPNSVVSIGDYAFNDVIHIEYHGTATGARWGARSMNGLIEGDFIYTDTTKTFLMVYIGSDTSVTIPGTVDSIYSAFRDDTTLKSVTIPASVTYLNGTFYNCSYLTNIICYAATPPQCFGQPFINVPHDAEIHVPCLSLPVYRTAYGWEYFSNINNAAFCMSPVTVVSNDTILGTAFSTWYDDTARLFAYPKIHCRFDGWSDGVTDNPRLLVPTGDTILTALFSPRDTMYVTDTLTVVRDTVWVIDTIILRDTIIINSDTIMPKSGESFGTNSGDKTYRPKPEAVRYKEAVETKKTRIINR